MYTMEENQTMNLNDSYTMLYSYIAQSVIEKFGEDGERAVREGTRRYGRDRAEATRKKHLDAGAKINMLNLFSLYHDLPSDPRFRREKQELNSQERVSHTLICPMADVWKEYGHMHIGRIYCEEFHSACYSNYAYGYTQVNLARTLTQDGDGYCAFNIVLRPENLPEKLRPVCFEEYDPTYVKPDFKPLPFSAKEGFNILSIKLYYYLLESACEFLGENGAKTVEIGLENFAHAIAQRLNKRAIDNHLQLDDDYREKNFPLAKDIDKEFLWDKYSKNNAKSRMKVHFYDVFKSYILEKQERSDNHEPFA